MKMNEYSEELKSAVMDFVKDERNEEENQNFIPNEVALPKKNFLTECKNYKIRLGRRRLFFSRV
jgi:hypothetical protein